MKSLWLSLGIILWGFLSLCQTAHAVLSVDMTCGGSETPVVNIDVTWGVPPTSDTETITCTVTQTDDADDDIQIDFTGNIDGANHSVITHANGIDTLTVLLDNPTGVTGSIPNLTINSASGVPVDFTFDATIDNLDTNTRSGVYTSLTPLTLTATAF